MEDDPGIGAGELEPGKNSDEIRQEIAFKSPQPPFAKGGDKGGIFFPL
jgi:hypothetical protein